MTEGTGANGGMRAPGSLAEPLDALASELEGVRRTAAGAAIEYARNGIPFAVREGDAVSFRLRSEIVGAALQTPDTRRSERGPAWIVLAPAAIDTFTLDRAIAWFESAWRIAGEPPRSTEPRAKPH